MAQGDSMFLIMEGPLKDKGTGSDVDPKGMKGALILTNWHWAAAQPSAPQPGKGKDTTPGGQADFHHIEFGKNVDKTSPLLMQCLASLITIPKCTLNCFDGKMDKPYVKIAFEGCHVSNLSKGGTNGPSALTESFTMTYDKFTYTYKHGDDAPVEFTWPPK